MGTAAPLSTPGSPACSVPRGCRGGHPHPCKLEGVLGLCWCVPTLGGLGFSCREGLQRMPSGKLGVTWLPCQSYITVRPPKATEQHCSLLRQKSKMAFFQGLGTVSG